MLYVEDVLHILVQLELSQALFDVTRCCLGLLFSYAYLRFVEHLRWYVLALLPMELAKHLLEVVQTLVYALVLNL